MKHDAALISAYHDGVLPPSRRRQVEGHIRGCAECRALLHDFQEMRKGMQALPWQQAPSGMLDRIKAQVAVERRQERRRGRYRPFAGVAAGFAAAAAAFLAGTLVPVASPLTPAEQRPVVAVAVPAADVSRVPRDSVIELQFANPIDRGSVEQSLHVSPPMAAQLRWQDDRLRIIPTDPLDADATYTIAVGPSGADAAAPPATVQVSTSPPSNSGPLPAFAEGRGPADAPLVRANTAPAATPTPASPQATPTPTWAVAALSAGSATVAQTCNVARGAVLARLAGERPDLLGRLGCAAAPEQRVTLAEQSFEAGVLVWRGDLHWTYALQSQPRRWSSYGDSVSGNLPQESVGAAPYGPAVRAASATPGAGRSSFLTATATPADFRESPTEPSSTFVRLWRVQPDLRSLIGGPVRGERQGLGVVQDFQHGLVVVTERGGVYTLFGDRGWGYLPEPDDAARLMRPRP